MLSHLKSVHCSQTFNSISFANLAKSTLKNSTTTKETENVNGVSIQLSKLQLKLTKYFDYFCTLATLQSVCHSGSTTTPLHHSSTTKRTRAYFQNKYYCSKVVGEFVANDKDTQREVQEGRRK